MIDLLALLDTLELQIVFGDLYDPETGIYPYADDDDIIEIWNLTSKKLGYDELALGSRIVGTRNANRLNRHKIRYNLGGNRLARKAMDWSA